MKESCLSANPGETLGDACLPSIIQQQWFSKGSRVGSKGLLSGQRYRAVS